jgi:hypothetical protein
VAFLNTDGREGTEPARLAGSLRQPMNVQPFSATMHARRGRGIHETVAGSMQRSVATSSLLARVSWYAFVSRVSYFRSEDLPGEHMQQEHSVADHVCDATVRRQRGRWGLWYSCMKLQAQVAQVNTQVSRSS